MKNNNKNGFTLAEALITLGIVGVVAALSTPMIVHRMADAQIPPKLYKFQSTFANATQRMLAEEGSDSILGIDSIARENENSPNRTRIMGELLSKYMKITDTTDNWYDVYNIDGTPGTRDPRARQYKTEGGMYFRFTAGWAHDAQEGYANIPTNQVIGLLHLDLDGPKGYNALSKDIFWFDIYNDGSLRAHGSVISDRSQGVDRTWEESNAPQDEAGYICDNGICRGERPAKPGFKIR